jgi:6-phospho-beta-glucosidase
MKLTLIGGGGVRSPLFVYTALRWHARIGLSELCLYDIDERKLRLFGALCREVVHRGGDPFIITTTTDARTALSGARHVVTTMRVGFEQGRVLDERIALRHGVLGQETTGPGGFAMALRSIPAILGYAGLLQELSPGAWMYNFTNPSGLVTQALRDAGFEHTIGICDGANTGQASIAHWAGVEESRIRAEVFGLNHLSWCRSARLDGEDLLPRALADDGYLRQAQGAFEPELVRMLGMHLNEYLYYYYYAEKALAAINGEGMTRGEEIKELNQRLIEQLGEIGVERDPERALRTFFGYEKRRGATYMHYAYGGTSAAEADKERLFDADIPAEAGEGYAGVALALVEALETGRPHTTALNVPNQGAIEGMRDDDVVEVSCRVDRRGVQPLPIGEVPAPQLGLMQTVKNYERLTVQANREHSRQLAVQALMAHPLVVSYARACPLVEAYLTAHSLMSISRVGTFER